MFAVNGTTQTTCQMQRLNKTKQNTIFAFQISTGSV